MGLRMISCWTNVFLVLSWVACVGNSHVSPHRGLWVPGSIGPEARDLGVSPESACTLMGPPLSLGFPINHLNWRVTIGLNEKLDLKVPYKL